MNQEARTTNSSKHPVSRVGIWLLGDQLWCGQAALEAARVSHAPGNIPVLMLESLEHVTQQRLYHYQKLILVWSAMRHFAEELRREGWPVTYGRVEQFETGLRDWVTAEEITDLWVMVPSDRPFQTAIATLAETLPCRLRWFPNNQFLWSRSEFADWAKGYRQLRLENFYREGRRRFQILMEGDEPVGGQWNFDQQNRKPPKSGLQPPEPLWFEPDAITQQVMADIRREQIPGWGDLEPFRWAVTRQQAVQVLAHFITVRLSTFGPYQDAMVTGEDTMWHGLLSPYLNLGLLHPREVIEAVERAYGDRPQSDNPPDLAPLNLASVEGFIRQVLGWREYMQGLYSYLGEDYGQSNWFEHHQPLPAFFWSGDTDMNCLRQTLDQTRRTGYAHHIQRLMLLANFALIAGIDPQETESWFHSAFIDAYDWVMQTNVIGMGLFADGGKLASKPYAASANYINKMSDYCKGCCYKPKEKLGDRACPFNYFYWDFLARHRHKLKQQGRMNLILAQLDRMDEAILQQMQAQAQTWHQTQAKAPPKP